ncbi:hypothetical protein [Bradyrhizobium erythrophlei]|uniref:Uncharacterized protein n=1 Tax=Bradyrhizobium erythrophlei TaxID=1437360 RepID=A0A1M5UG26_9BRAD|nr:hypothetical protein [Bradyrhizobium erythrophlei]SHH62002.1 hypothetical protein SAMN05443248_5430 [Bradyrhizobium erythrophlei]
MDSGATATIVAAIIGGAVTLTVTFRKSAQSQWQTLSKNRKYAVFTLVIFSLGLLIGLLTQDLGLSYLIMFIILLLIAAVYLFVAKSPPQSN